MAAPFREAVSSQTRTWKSSSTSVKARGGAWTSGRTTGFPTGTSSGSAIACFPSCSGSGRAGSRSALAEGASVRPEEWSRPHPVVASGALEVLTASGWMRREGESYRVTTVGRERFFPKGPGPFGIIETYHPYMQRCREILLEGTSSAHVSRGENVGASQDANRATFEQANDALDRFCRETGFHYRGVHRARHRPRRGDAPAVRAIGRSTPLRGCGSRGCRDRRGDGGAATGRASREHDLRPPGGHRPARRSAFGALEAPGSTPEGAVMLVGNGFHEVRGQTDDSMVDVFRGYHRAGFVLLFTEESALSVDDLEGHRLEHLPRGLQVRARQERPGPSARGAAAAPRPPGPADARALERVRPARRLRARGRLLHEDAGPFTPTGRRADSTLRSA